MANDNLYIVVPCFNEQEALQVTNDILLHQLDALIQAHKVSCASKVLYVDDGSTDHTWDVISNIVLKSKRVLGVRLAANSGQQNALMAGLEASVNRADVMITIDADLQDDCTVMAQMMSEYDRGCDVVYGVRSVRRSDSWFKRNTAQVFYRMMHRLGVNTVYNHADFRLMSKRAVNHLLSFRERNLFLRGIVPLVGFCSSQVRYDRAARMAGESKYSFHKMLSFAVDGITSFSIKPVRMVFSLGLVFLLIALGILIYTLIAYFTHRAVSGWSSLMLSLWFIGGCVLMSLGIVGEYIGKIYIEVKDRPRYYVDATLGFDDITED